VELVWVSAAAGGPVGPNVGLGQELGVAPGPGPLMGQSCQGLGVGLRGELLVDGRAAGRLEDLGAMGCHSGVPLMFALLRDAALLEEAECILLMLFLELGLLGSERVAAEGCDGVESGDILPDALSLVQLVLGLDELEATPELACLALLVLGHEGDEIIVGLPR